MKNFNKALSALLKENNDEANQLLSQFMAEHLAMISSDLAEDMVPRAKEYYVRDFDASRRFAKVLNHIRGNKETNPEVIANIREHGQCFFIAKFRVTQPYDIRFYKVDNDYYALFYDKASPDTFERIKFYDEEEVQNFVNSFC